MLHLVSLVLILVATSPVGADPIPPAALGARTVRFTYEARITPPDGAREVEVWLPLPREDDQRVLDVRLTGTAPATVVRLFPAGDRAAYMRIAAPHGPVTLAATATVARREVRVDAAGRDATTARIDPAIFAADLAPDGAVQINDEIRAIARRETRGKKTVTAQARALYDWVYDHMQYDKSVPGYGLGDIPYCLKVGKGNCTDFHTLFIALARASSIPARWNMGFPVACTDGPQPASRRSRGTTAGRSSTHRGPAGCRSTSPRRGSTPS